jgi:hypothetical protein
LQLLIRVVATRAEERIGVRTWLGKRCAFFVVIIVEK